MRKFLITVLGFTLLPMLFACKGNKTGESEQPDDKFKLLAMVKNLGEKLEVEVIESEYAFGEYWVITPSDIKYTDKDGNEISREDLTVGDKIEITYRGQVMMSYPPQIVATGVKIVG